MKSVTRNHIALLIVGVAAIMAAFAFAGHPLVPPELLASIGMVPMFVGDTDIKEVKTLIEDQGKAFAEFRKTNDELLKAKAEGKAVGDIQAKLDQLEKKLTSVDEAKAALDEIQKKLNRPGGGGQAQQDLEVEAKAFNMERKSQLVAAGSTENIQDLNPDQYAAYKSAFLKGVRRGSTAGLSPDEQKALSSGIDSDGGFFLPASTTGRTVRRVYDLSPIRQIAAVQALSSDSLEGLVDIDEADAGWVGETATRTDTDTPQVQKYKIDVHEMYAQPKATQKLLDDAAVDIEAWLAEKVGNKFGRLEGAAFCVGNGVAKPRGVAAYDTAATGDDTRAWGVLQHVLSGANGAFAASPNQADVLFDLMGAFKPHFLGNAKWLTRREVITLVRKFKNGQGDYLWQPSLVAGQPDKLMDYPIVIAQDMPALAAGSLSLAFGDFMMGYQIVDRLGMRTLRDPFTAKPFVRFYTIKRTGGGVIDFEAIKFVKFA